jgi:hypothetical protein
MSKDTDKSFFISSPLANKYAGLYQQLLSGIVSYKELGNRIIKRIKAAHTFRQVEHVRELSRVLINIPIKEYQLIAQYYLVWCQCRESQLHPDILQNIITDSNTYKTKALLSLAGFEGLKGNLDSEFYLYTEALKSSSSISDYAQASMGIAVVKAKEGFHDSALKDLEIIILSIKHAEPIIYFDVLNSYAVELGEAGRKDEARNIIKHVVASPFAFAYPEWQETAIDLKEPNRSFISVPSIVPEQAIQLEPVAVDQPPSNEANPEPPTKVLPFPPPDSAFPPLKEAPRPKKPKRVTSTELGGMNLAQKREAILAAIRSGAVPDREYNKMMFMLGMVKSGPADHLIDLEDDAVLTGLIMQWAHMIVPEQLAAVMSALRDCKDDLRRANIIDNIIRKAFECSKTCNVTESEWRLEVECRLPEK